MYVFTPSADALAVIAGAVLSLLFSYVPGLNTWFAAKAPEFKRLFMAVLMLVVAGAAIGLSCAQIISGVACTQAGLFQLLGAWILAVAANQGAYSLTVPTKAVAQVKKLQAGAESPNAGRG